ncbi:hypothetical protein HY416_03190 [Candidatus Kaiserbacteria bacterium]|nr:hypothetical protein [Candidatus Kaiserbacteria bacterium]
MQVSWCFTPAELESHNLDLGKVCVEIAEAFLAEPHLLHPSPEDLETSFRNELSVIGVADDNVVCHTRLTLLTQDWYELGSTWVRRNYRRMGITHGMYSIFLPRHEERDILATTTNEDMLRIGESFGFVMVRRQDLPREVWQASCTCPAKKIGPDGPTRCALAFGESLRTEGLCFFRVTAPTAKRHRIAA